MVVGEGLRERLEAVQLRLEHRGDVGELLRGERDRSSAASGAVHDAGDRAELVAHAVEEDPERGAVGERTGVHEHVRSRVTQRLHVCLARVVERVVTEHRKAPGAAIDQSARDECAEATGTAGDDVGRVGAGGERMRRRRSTAVSAERCRTAVAVADVRHVRVGGEFGEDRSAQRRTGR